MNRKIIVLLLIVTAAALTVASSGYCEFGPRFGPWKYYAPYYFPRTGCLGMCFSPADYVPIYEDPNPLVPGLPTPLPPPRRPTKVKAPGFQAMQQRGPIAVRMLPSLPPAQPVPTNNAFYRTSGSPQGAPPTGPTSPLGSPIAHR
jgi:hypothetical protein